MQVFRLPGSATDMSFTDCYGRPELGLVNRREPACRAGSPSNRVGSERMRRLEPMGRLAVRARHAVRLSCRRFVTAPTGEDAFDCASPRSAKCGALGFLGADRRERLSQATASYRRRGRKAGG